MNTLPRAITATIFRDQQQYVALRARWSYLVNTTPEALRPEHYLLYLALLGKDWRRAFTPISNRTKIEHGGIGGWAYWRAEYALFLARPRALPEHVSAQHVERVRATYDQYQRKAEEYLLAPFDGMVTQPMLQAVLHRLPHLNRSDYLHHPFTRDTWPCDAYVAPAEEFACAG